MAISRQESLHQKGKMGQLSKKFLNLALASAASVAILAGCSGHSVADADGTEPTQQAEKVEKAKAPPDPFEGWGYVRYRDRDPDMVWAIRNVGAEYTTTQRKAGCRFSLYEDEVDSEKKAWRLMVELTECVVRMETDDERPFSEVCKSYPANDQLTPEAIRPSWTDQEIASKYVTQKVIDKWYEKVCP